MRIHGPQRARSIPASGAVPLPSTRSHASSTASTHSPRPPIGGNIGGSSGGIGGGNVGSPPPTSDPFESGGSPTTSPSPPPFAPTIISNPPTTPTTTSITIVLPTPLSSNPQVTNGANSNVGSGGTVTFQLGPGTNPANSVFMTGTAGAPPPSVTTDGSGAASGTQVGAGKVNGPPISGDPTTQTLLGGEISTTTIPTSNSPSQTNAVTGTSNRSHSGLTSGGVAGIIAVLAIFFLAVFLIILRRRKAARAERHDEMPDVFANSPPSPQQRESGIVRLSPGGPQDNYQNHTPTTQPSSDRQMDAYPGYTLQRGPSPLAMAEIDERPRPVPTLVLRNERFRRHNHRLSVVTEIPNDSRRYSGARHRDTRRDDASPISPHSSDASAFRTAPSTLRGSGMSPTSSQTSLQAPPSPRTPTRGSAVIPPIPPLPKSPPPIPGVHANPFVDRNPFADPAG